MSEIPEAPPRLSQERAEDAELLRRVNRRFAADIDEPHAFERLERRLAAPPRARGLALGFGLALIAVSALVVLNRRPAPIAVTAEPIAAHPKRPLATPEPAPRRTAEEPPAAPSSSIALPRIESRARSSEPRGKAASALGGDGADCLKLARDGDNRAAERCFEVKSRGNGLGAEYSLYELARLRRDLLEDSSGALAALEQHRARFPRGGLRAEVELTRVELLVKIGRSAEALAEVERLLASGASREREVELTRMRDKLRGPAPVVRDPPPGPSASSP